MFVFSVFMDISFLFENVGKSKTLINTGDDGEERGSN
jgi:hypothetical protein